MNLKVDKKITLLDQIRKKFGKNIKTIRDGHKCLEDS